LYDFSKKIGGEQANVINLVPAGVEPHEWTPKSQDISQINKAELFVYEGGGFEGWTDDFLNSLKPGSKPKVIEASKGQAFMKGAEEGNDPHVWLSPLRAKKLAENIMIGMAEADPAHKDVFEANFTKLAGQFDALDAKMKDALSKTTKKDIVVSHEAFGYMSKDYGLTQKAIMGLSPDAEPTAQDMKAIKDFVKQNNVKYIFFEDLVSDKLAKTLARETGIETMVLSPLEGLTDEQQKQGADYFSVMESNLQNLLKALQ
jgi:zinc transport system substrate-binding protein